MPNSARYGRIRPAASNGKPACSCNRYVATHLALMARRAFMAEHDERPRRHVDDPVSLDDFPLHGQVRTRGVERDSPARMIQLIRDAKRHGFMMGVQQQQEVLVLSPPAFAV